MVADVGKASRLNIATSPMWRPSPEIIGGKPYAHLLRLSTCGDQDVALLLTSSAATWELALYDLLAAMLAPFVPISRESLSKAGTSFHMAWFVVSDRSTFKDSQILKGLDWFEYLVRIFETLKRAINRGIVLALWSAALVRGLAYKALENRSSAPVCNWGLVGPRNLLVAGCRWRLKGGKFSYTDACSPKVVVVYSWVLWTLLVDQVKILWSLREGESPSPLFRTLCCGFVGKWYVVFDIECVAKQFGGRGLRGFGVRLLADMGAGIVFLQLLTSALGMFVEEVLMLHIVPTLKAVQDESLFHLQQEVATFGDIEDFVEMNLEYVVNSVFGVVLWLVDWSVDDCLLHWKICCGWILGFSHHEDSLVVPVGVALPGCLGKGTECRNFCAVRFIQNFLLVTGLTAELRGAIESASIQQFHQRDSLSSGKTGGTRCKIVLMWIVQFKPPENYHSLVKVERMDTFVCSGCCGLWVCPGVPWTFKFEDIWVPASSLMTCLSCNLDLLRVVTVSVRGTEPWQQSGV